LSPSHTVHYKRCPACIEWTAAHEAENTDAENTDAETLCRWARQLNKLADHFSDERKFDCERVSRLLRKIAGRPVVLDPCDQCAHEAESEEDPREQLRELIDRLRNGVRLNEDGTYTLVWTQRQLDCARQEAERFAELFKIGHEAESEEG
jgi:hypothetical protein